MNADYIFFGDGVAQWIMATLSLVGTLVSAWAVWLVRRTLLANSEAVDQARVANKLAESTSRLELRAYLAVEPLGVRHLIESHNAKGHVLVKNVGRSPAKNVEVIVRMKRCRRDAWVPDESLSPKESDRTILPGAAMPQGSIELDDIDRDSVRASDGHIFVWGIVRYDNGNDESCFTRFCHRYACVSHDRSVNLNDAYREGLYLIKPDKARYHETGNDAS